MSLRPNFDLFRVFETLLHTRHVTRGLLYSLTRSHSINLIAGPQNESKDSETVKLS